MNERWGDMSEELMEKLEEESMTRYEFMTFQMGKEFFGISIEYVDEIVAMQPITLIPETPDYVKGLINLRGKIIPVIDVRMKFGMEPVAYTDRTCVIVIHVGATVVGLIVEKIAEVHDVTDEDLIPLPKAHDHWEFQEDEYIYSLAKAGDKVILLLQLEKLLETEDTESVEEEQEEE